jgi:ribonucleoside-diphosphate reductase alpha chain
VDVENPATKDDFVLGLKELLLPTGQRWPYAVWLAGDYPRTLAGLCKSLSYDMRVIDPAWIGAKLRQLLDFPEPRGDFFAWVPGEKRQANFPSTIAYIARLMIHRYAMLGLLDEAGQPRAALGVVTQDEASHAVYTQTPVAGERCRACGNLALMLIDGCRYCSACGFEGECG